jgi:hypothetical protein
VVDYVVTVTGPGACVNNVAALIQQVLESEGLYATEVVNPHPNAPCAEQAAWVRSLPVQHWPLGVVRIEVSHLPWGG